MLSQNIQDELSARMQALMQPLFPNNEDISEISDALDGSIFAVALLQKGMLAQIEMIGAYMTILGVLEVRVPPPEKPSDFLKKLTKEE